MQRRLPHIEDCLLSQMIAVTLACAFMSLPPDVKQEPYPPARTSSSTAPKRGDSAYKTTIPSRSDGNGLSDDGTNTASAASQPGIPRVRKSAIPCPGAKPICLERLSAKCFVLICHIARIRSTGHQPCVSNFVGRFFLRRLSARSMERGFMVRPKRRRTASTASPCRRRHQLLHESRISSVHL